MIVYFNSKRRLMNNHDMINLEVRLIVIEFLIMIDIDGYFTISDGINRG